MNNKLFISFKRIVCLALFAVALYFTFIQMNIFYKDLSKADDSVELFYELKKEEAQVLCIGSSHVYCGINPGVFWEKTGGVTCALMASSRQSPRGTYYYLMEALQQNKGDVIYVDIYGMIEDFFHTDVRTIRGMRPTKAKFEAIKDMMDDENQNYVIWDFFYLTSDSSRWQYLDGHNKVFYLNRPYRVNRGYSFSIDRIEPGSELIAAVSEEELEKTHLLLENEKYLYKILDLCDKYSDRNIIFVRVPTLSLNFEEKTTGEIAEIISARGYTFIDIDDYMPELGYDDFCNRGHLNNDGAEKVSKWLADYTMENFDVLPLKNTKADMAMTKFLEAYRAEVRQRYEIKMQNS